MINQRNTFLQTIKEQIKSKEAQEYVTKELQHHLNEAKDYWKQKGVDSDEAEQKAILHMGNPIVLGQKLNQIHRPKIDWITISLLITSLLLGFLPLVAIGYAQVNYFLVHKLLFMVFGIALAILLMLIDYRKLMNKGLGFYLVGCFLLLYIIYRSDSGVFSLTVKVGPLTIESLMALPFFYLTWASFFQSRQFKIWQFMILFTISAILFSMTASATAFFIYGVMTFSMIWWSKFNKIKIMLVLGSFFMVTFIYIGVSLQQMKAYQIESLLAFLNPYEFVTGNSLRFQIPQVHEMIKSSGWFGTKETTAFIPEAHTNFVFLSFIYHYGWLLALILLGILSLLVIRIVQVTGKINNSYSKLLLVGAVSVYATQLIANVGMLVGFFPLTSMLMPFISYGLMPIALNSFFIGMVLSVYRRKDIAMN